MFIVNTKYVNLVPSHDSPRVTSGPLVRTHLASSSLLELMATSRGGTCGMLLFRELSS